MSILDGPSIRFERPGDSAAPKTQAYAASRMRVVCMISFLDRGAGAQQALMRLSQQLTLRGHDVETWFLYRKSDVDTGDLAARLFSEGRLTLPQLFFLPFRLLRAIRQTRPDSVVSFLPLANTLGLLCAWFAGVKTRVASQRTAAGPYSPIMRIADKILGTLGLYTSNVCVSTAVKESFRAYPSSYKARLCVVHNGIVWKPSSATCSDARRKLGLPETGMIFAAAGRLTAQKNYVFLLDAFARAKDSYLVIAGDGELRQELQDLVQRLGIGDRVFFLGAVERQVIPDLFRAADAFVQSSLFEGQSNALLEAMHAGLPILVNDIPEQRETIVDEETGEAAGLLASVGDTAMWVELLQRLSDDAALRQNLSALAQQMVARRFTLDRMIDGFEQTLRSGSANAP